MLGIFGVYHRDGRPVSHDVLSAMRARMHGGSQHGSDPDAGVWSEGPCGLGQIAPVSAAAHGDHGPQWLTTPRLAFAATARLDARDELCDALDVPHAERRTLTDVALVRRAWLRWGEAAPEHLIGDWAYAVWRPDSQSLHLARDPQGAGTLYTFVDDRHVAWASNLRALFALPAVSTRIDEPHLAGVLTAWTTPRSTCYADIERLPLGHALTVAPTSVRLRQYVDLADVPPLRLASDADYVEAFDELFARAVADRLSSTRPVAVALSGGLDSGAVAATAGRLHSPGTPGLVAISHVPRFRQPLLGPRIADEAPLIAATARAAGIAEITYLDSAQRSPLWGMRRSLEIHGVPAPAPSNQFWLLDLMMTARERGYDTLLTGELGNVTMSWPGRPAARDWRAHLRRRDWRAAVAALLSEPWSARVRAARRSGRGETPWRAYSAIHPRFAARLRLAELMAADGHDPTFARARGALEQRVRMLRASTSELAEAGAAHGVDVRDPTSDLRVVRFCLSTPEAQFLGPRAEGRWLIRRAMSGRLPPEVVWNRRRGLQSADLVLRLRAHADEVEAALERCARDAVTAEYVDVVRLRQVWASVRERHDFETQGLAVAVLCRGLMTGLFVSGAV